MLPFGKFHPDKYAADAKICVRAVNCLPDPQGYRPLPGPVEVSDGLPERCLGAVTAQKLNGAGEAYAGTADRLYSLSNTLDWVDASRPSGDYGTDPGERWNWAQFGQNLVATNFSDDVQFINVENGTTFDDLAGTPPKARYPGVMREFLVLAGIEGEEDTLRWSGLNDIEEWTPGVKQSGGQQMPTGGPISGFIGGEVGYVMQRARVTRMTYLPGSEFTMQFDEVEGGRGLQAPHSLVRLGRFAFYLSSDGFYRMDLSSGAAEPIGVGKWINFFRADVRAGSSLFVLGLLAPGLTAIVWPYVSRANTTDDTIPDKAVIYDWTLDEATIAHVNIEAVASWVTEGVTLDTMNPLGNMDTLIVSLDSPFYRGGEPLAGIITTNGKLAHFQGPAMQAQFETCDGHMPGRRTFITGTEPMIDTEDLSVEVAMRERFGDVVNFNFPEVPESTGDVPAWASGNYGRARITIKEGAAWTVASGLETIRKDAGAR